MAVVAPVAYLHLLSPEAVDRDTGTAALQLRSPVAPVGSSVANVDDVSVLREEVASLRAELLQLRKLQMAGSGASAGNGRQAQPGPQNTADGGGESGGDLRAEEMTREEEARQFQARIASIDASFRREVVDQRWSANTSSRVQSVLSSDKMGHMQADSIDCRSESCRVELHDNGSGQLNKNMPMIAAELAGTLSNITASSATRPDGRVSMVLYLSRQAQGASAVTK
jgi:hypothetical protein